ncbi:filamin-binding LIM protein 1 isoform X2 [Rhinoraja longicauda]
MSQAKKVSSVYIKLVPPGTTSAQKTRISLGGAKADDGGHETLVPSTPKSRNPSSRLGNVGLGVATGSIQSPLYPASEDYLPPPPPPAPESTRDVFHPSELPLPPPPPPLSDEDTIPSLNYSKHTEVPQSNGGAGFKQQELPPPSEFKKNSIPPAGIELENPLPNTVDNKLDGSPRSSADICAFCNQLIPPTTTALKALDKMFHENCLKCRKCNCKLVGKNYYNLGGNPHCDSCYQDTLEKCGKCNKAVTSPIIRATDKAFHPECFTCIVCHRPIGTERFGVNQAGEVHCLEDFQRRYAPQCCVCKMPIIPVSGTEECINIELFGLRFHVNCYKCEKCGILLSPDPTEEGCFPLNKQILCKTCHISLSASSTT